MTDPPDDDRTRVPSRGEPSEEPERERRVDQNPGKPVAPQSAGQAPDSTPPAAALASADGPVKATQPEHVKGCDDGNHKHSSCDSRPGSHDTIQTAALVVTTVVTCFALRYACNQATQAERQANITEEQLDAAVEDSKAARKEAADALKVANRQADIAREQMTKSARAWLMIEEIRPLVADGSGPIYSAMMLNSGDTPALDVRVSSNSKAARDSANPDFTYGSDQPRNIGPIGPRVRFPLEFPERPDVAGKTRFVYGTIEYSDVFGCAHWTKFCGRYDPAARAFTACDVHNDIDRNEQTDCAKALPTEAAPEQ